MLSGFSTIVFVGVCVVMGLVLLYLTFVVFFLNRLESVNQLCRLGQIKSMYLNLELPPKSLIYA